MKKSLVIIGLISLALAIVIFIFADGLRRYYSGGFFLLLAVVLLLQARRADVKPVESALPHEEKPGEEGAASGPTQGDAEVGIEEDLE